MKQPRVAIVHDYLWTLGGAEKVVESLAQTFPDAPIYTSFYLKDQMNAQGFSVASDRIRTTWMQLLPFKRALYKLYFLLYPLVFHNLKLKGFDVVISSSSYAALNTTVAEGTIHLCYCHTPSRYLYGYDTELDHAKIKKYLPFMDWLYKIVRGWDQAGAKGVDQWVANSEAVRGRIQRHYGKDALVIYPPVETQRFLKLKTEDKGYYYTYGRLVAHKRVDIIVAAFNQLGEDLVVAGSGLEYERLKAMAQDNIRFLGRVTDEVRDQYLAGCTALIFAADEDFGIVPVEAMAAGKSVVAYQAGGVLESVLPGKTGEFFSPQTAQALAEVLADFKPRSYDPKTIQNQAARFDKSKFQDKISALVEQLWQKETIDIS